MDTVLFELYKKNKDESVKISLLEKYDFLAFTLARKYSNRGQSYDDLYQVAQLGLLNAIQRFDLSKNNDFMSFARPTIEGEIKRYFRDKTWKIKVPREMQELSLKIRAAEEDFAKNHGKVPDTDELAKTLSVDISKIEEAKKAGNVYVISDLSSDKSADDPDYKLLEDGEWLKSLFKYLSPQEKKVLELKFYNDLSQAEIAEKLDLSQMQVSRIIRKSLDKLHKKAKVSI